MSVCSLLRVSACNNYSATGWFFKEICLIRFQKSVEKIMYLLNSDKSNRCFKFKPICVQDKMPTNFLKNKNIYGQYCRSVQNI